MTSNIPGTIGQIPQTGAVVVVGARVVVVVVGKNVVVTVVSSTVVVGAIVVTVVIVVDNGVGAGVGAFVGQLACVQFLPI